VKVLIDDARMVIDLTELPPQVPAPINAGANGGGMSMARLAYKSLVAPYHPADIGLFDPLEVKMVEGTLLTARKGAAMGQWNVPMATFPDVILRAIGERRPELVPAGHHGTMGTYRISGRDKAGNWWTSLDTIPGGWGGSADADGFGPLKTIAHGDNRDIPVEIVEARFPLRVLQYSFAKNSAGRGTHRGGFGVERVIKVMDDAVLDTSMDRTVDPPWGLAGGESGQPGTIEIRRPADETWREQKVKKISHIQLPKGSVVRIRSAGGGGWGPPEHRTEAAKTEDTLAGLIVDNTAQ